MPAKEVSPKKQDQSEEKNKLKLMMAELQTTLKQLEEQSKLASFELIERQTQLEEQKFRSEL